jgi:AmmeMemoRadiSam system protein B
MKPLFLDAALAGPVYPRSEKLLLRLFSGALERATPTPRVPRATRVWVVPHIDFRVSLSAYARTYRHLLEMTSWPSTFVILGVGHTCPHEVSSLPCGFRTPLGTAECNADLWTTLQTHSPLPLARAPRAWPGEHSIEFVVIWLQALARLRGHREPVRILPVLLGGLGEALLAGTGPDADPEFASFQPAFQKILTASSDWQIIASIDGCHVGPRFGHDQPVTPPLRRTVAAWERTLWSECRSDRFDRFWNHLALVQNRYYFDGSGVLSLLLRSFPLRFQRFQREEWFDPTDHSLVSFTGGALPPLRT